MEDWNTVYSRAVMFYSELYAGKDNGYWWRPISFKESDQGYGPFASLQEAKDDAKDRGYEYMPRFDQAVSYWGRI
jgi:hypothetical protein